MCLGIGICSGTDPILDEDAGPLRCLAWLTGGTIVGVTQFPDLDSTEPFNERRPGLDHLAFGCATRVSLRHGKSVLTKLGIPEKLLASWTRLPTRHCRFEIPTTSHLSSSHPGAKTGEVSDCLSYRPSHTAGSGSPRHA